jgi:signal transduction histidine kinase
MSARQSLVGFGLALVALFAAAGWITSVALRLEGAEHEARRQAVIEENVRLALWRMDSALVPLIARENARAPADAQTPRARPEFVRQFFELDATGEVGPVRGAEILAALSGGAAAAPPIGAPPEKGPTEWQLRTANLEECAQAVTPGGAPLTPVWVHGELLLARRLGASSVQGAWLDWPQVQRWLPNTIRDLLPEARVEPASARDETERRLAALPLKLIPGQRAANAEGQPSSVRLVLAVAWAGLLLAALAVLGLMAGTLALSERRATFVSAVTHELRTPLTTLQTYAEMLVEGKVVDAVKRQQYLETLHTEALRLSHLVNNVLAYSGVERGRTAVALETLEVAALLEKARERLAGRAAQAGMTLGIDCEPSLQVQGDAGPIDQILFNIVDNAAKYAAGGITITALARGTMVELRVQDQGPGVRNDARRRLFEPFSKSAEKAAGTAPGVGLGLALSRSLARAMGGNVTFEPAEGGACFVLSLRRV